MVKLHVHDKIRDFKTRYKSIGKIKIRIRINVERINNYTKLVLKLTIALS